MAELRSLIGALNSVRRRIFLNHFLSDSVWWASLILLGLLLAAALSPTLNGAVVAAVLLSAAGLATAAIRSLRILPSSYEAAARLDNAAGLKDRLATALFFSHVENPEGLLRRQREDALAHLAPVNPRLLFPLRLPAGMGRALLLLLAVAGLFAYRMHSGPPILALLRRAADTPIARAILSPIVHAMERDRATPAPNHPPAAQQVADNRAPEQQAGEGRSGAPEDGKGQEAQKKSEAASNSSRRREAQRDEQGAKAGNDGQQEQEEAQQQQGQQGRDPQGNQQQAGGRDQSGQQRSGSQQARNGGNSGQSAQQQQNSGGESGANQNQSLARTVMQALKNLLSSATGSQGAPSRGQMSQEAPQAAPQSSPQAGNPGNNSPQPSQAGKQDSESAARSASGPQPPQPGQKSGTGIGQQPGTDQARQNEPLPSSMAPDTVPLEAQQFVGEAQVRARVGDGTVATVARNVAPPAAASGIGTEQENVPARYRFYMQRYFDHAAKGGKGDR